MHYPYSGLKLALLSTLDRYFGCCTRRDQMSINGPSEISAKASRGRPDGGFLGLLHTVALTAVVAGAGGSVGLMLRVGHRNPSRILLVLFVIWVLSPFIALILADILAKRWSVLTRATLYGVMLILTLGSLA